MKKESLLKKLDALGYPLLKTEYKFDLNEVLAETVKSNDTRLWEAFPLLLANSFRKEAVNLRGLDKHLKKSKDKLLLRSLVAMSCALYEYLGLKFGWVDELKNSRYFGPELFNEFLSHFRTKQALPSKLKNVSTERVVSTFKTYFSATMDVNTHVQMNKDFALEYALSQVFSKKQKELFMKKLRSEKMTKTEREYYSRTVKKKVMALANETLHKLALQISRE